MTRPTMPDLYAADLRMLSLFAGIGGLDIAAGWAGIETIAFVEIDPFCRAVLRKRWPDVPQFEDVKHVTADTLRRAGITGIDIICGGFPCQDVSLAGSRAGLGGERSTLWFEFARLIREIRPRWVVGENVPGLLSANDGRFMAAVLGDLAALGYNAGWGVWGAGDVGARHKRERVFIVGHDERRGLQQRGEPGVLREAAGGTEGEAPERKRVRDAVGGAGSPVGDSPCGGCGMRGGAPGRAGQPVCADEAVADAEMLLWRRADSPDYTGRRHPEVGGQGIAGDRAEYRQPQSGLGEPAHGLSAGLVRCGVHPAVAGPGEVQYEHEPPRVAVGVKHRARKLKALGNAVDPYQAYPLFAAIVEVTA